ncbi:MAG: hypothetical protein U0K91_01985 [Acutalibacteraceae bacterium]|nr:hypothetical protein [Acutalibacteraceae bacterium]
MKKRISTKLTAFFVALTLVFMIGVPAFAAPDEDVMTACKGNCGQCPSLVIPGIFQSEVFLYDENGEIAVNADGEQYAGPFYLESTMEIVKVALSKALVPLIMALVLQRDVADMLATNVGEAIGEILMTNIKCDENGDPIKDIRATKYPTSVEYLSEHDREHILDNVPLQKYIDVAGADHLYFFSYYSLGNMIDTVEELYDYIQLIKKQTGHDKINIVPISQGGSLANMLLQMYKDKGRDISEDINRIVYVVPAKNGSTLVGEIIEYGLLDDDEAIYGYMIPKLLEGDWYGYLINLALRIFPKDVLNSILDSAVKGLVDGLKYSTLIWGLCPKENYPAGAEMYLSDESTAEIRRQTDIFYQAQCNADQNILDAIASGVKVFDICGYNYSLYAIVDSWDNVNADGIIQLESTSMGAVSYGVDVELPEDYVTENPHCTNYEHNHIDPHNIVDARAGLLPDTTFYFYNQNHERTGNNDVVMRLAVDLLTDENFVDVYSYPDRYPQFNTARNTKGISNDIKAAKTLDFSAMDPAVAAELEAAIAKVEAELENTVVDNESLDAAKEEFYAARAKARGEQYPEENDDQTNEILGKIFKLASDVTYKFFGPRGWFDIMI